MLVEILTCSRGANRLYRQTRRCGLCGVALVLRDHFGEDQWSQFDAEGHCLEHEKSSFGGEGEVFLKPWVNWNVVESIRQIYGREESLAWDSVSDL